MSSYTIHTLVKTSIASTIRTTITDVKIGTYYERHGRHIANSDILKGLSYLLSAQPYNPVLWGLYTTCRFLYDYKPKSFLRKEIVVNDYYLEKQPWVSGSFLDLCDVILIDNVSCDNPNFALVTLGQENDRIFDNTIPSMYYIPVEWLKCIAARNGLFVLLSFKFCCHEVLLRSSTQLVRCQSLILDSEYLVDTTYFHVGCGPCTPVTETLVEVFAAVPLNAGIRNLMKMFEEYDFHFMNSAEMLYALVRYEPCLQYYKKDGELVLHKGCDIRNFSV